MNVINDVNENEIKNSDHLENDNVYSNENKSDQSYYENLEKNDVFEISPPNEKINKFEKNDLLFSLSKLEDFLQFLNIRKSMKLLKKTDLIKKTKKKIARLKTIINKNLFFVNNNP